MKKNTSGPRFKALLEAANITTTGFAEFLDTAPQNVHNWYTRGVPAHCMEEVARKLSVSSDWLKTGEGSKDAQHLRLLDESGNTFDAHRLEHFAAERGAGDRAVEVLMDAYFCKSLPVGDRTALASLAPAMGLDEAEVRAMLESDAYAEAVRADEAEAGRQGISGVPFFVINGRERLSGAQPVEVFAEALARS